MTVYITDQQKKIVERMATNGMNLNIIAIALGCAERTLYYKKDVMEIYHKAFAQKCEKIGEAIFTRALRKGSDKDTGASKLLMFIANTRLGWSNPNVMPDLDFTDKNYVQSKRHLQELLRDKKISTKMYRELSATLIEEFKVDEHEQRLTALEKIVEEKQNLGGYKQRDDLQ